MKGIRSFLVIMMLAVTVAAQSAAPPAKPPQKPQVPAKPPAAKQVTAPAPTPGPAPTARSASSQPGSKVSAKSAAASVKAKRAAKPSKAAQAPVKPAAEGSTEKPAAETKAVTAWKGKRDPFVSIIRSRGLSYPTCGTSKRCLIIDQLVLKGVVKSPHGMLAVVETGRRKAYFLRENDPVFNGQVVKITGDSIIFRETVINRAGKESQREVVKRMIKPV
ncbi:MAG: hypothetical protein ACE14M_06825 [Terriglobales bacterium]